MATATTRTPAAKKLEPVWEAPKGLVTFLTTVDHKRIGTRYLVTAGIFFCLAGLEALTMRTQLAVPRNDVVGPESFNELFSMHGITMIFLFATPMLSGFGNYFVPLMIGARDMAFPRVNAFSYWTFLGAGVFLYSSFLVGHPPNDGWFNYVPLSSRQYTPGTNIDFYNLGLLFLAVSTTAGAINFIVTIMRLRAPGMSINRIPLFCWAILAQSLAIIFALPALTTANILLELERHFGFHFFDASAGGDPILWQHLFWIFGHPDVYIIFLPAIGIVSAIVPVFSRRSIVGYEWLVFATLATALIGFAVWVHHMFALGLPQVEIGFFSAVSMLITIPSGIQIFGWLATMLGGRPVLKTPMLFVVGFVVTFVVGGVTGVMFAAIPFDQQVTDSYFVVAHFHYVLFGGSVFPIIGGLYYWLPKITGRMLSEALGKLSFWLVFCGFNLTFFPMHISGLLGMPRRVYTYPANLGWDVWNMLSTVGAFVLGLGILAVVANIVWSLTRGAPAPADPWSGNTLEWATSSPPAEYNFEIIPTVRSADPNWDAHERAEDFERAMEADDELVMAEGHRTLGTTVLDGEPDEALHMPEESIFPLLLMLSLAVIFTGLLIEVYLVAIFGVAAALAVVAGWHRPKPELEEQ